MEGVKAVRRPPSLLWPLTVIGKAPAQTDEAGKPLSAVTIGALLLRDRITYREVSLVA